MNGRPSEPAAPDLRLHGPRPSVVRLSKKVLVGGASVSALVLLGIVAYAMTNHRPSKGTTELYDLGGGPPEQVRGLPSDYRSTPRLGPPLPGDLGGPMLASGVPAPDIGNLEPASGGDGDAEARVARERLTQERESARTSTLFAGGTKAPAAPIRPETQEPSTDGRESARLVERTQDERATSAERLASPASPYVIQAGAVIPAALVTGVRSDLPGQVIGQVTQNVYDTPTGRILLVPQGARLIGVYENRIAFGQTRVLLAWTRLLLPDGRSLILEKAPAGDRAGHAGLEGRVDRHWSGLFGMAALSTLLGIGAELGSSDEEDSIVRALRTAAADSFNQVGRQAVGKGLDIAPTLTIRPGAPVRVMVTRDLVLQPYQS